MDVWHLRRQDSESYLLLLGGRSDGKLWPSLPTSNIVDGATLASNGDVALASNGDVALASNGDVALASNGDVAFPIRAVHQEPQDPEGDCSRVQCEALR